MPAVHLRLPLSVLRLIRASRARLPPSPLLSARMMTVTYLSVTTIIIDQKIRLSTPKISSAPCGELVMAGEGLAEGVDRAGADVAEDDADRADGELDEAGLGMVPGRSVGGLLGGGAVAHRSGTETSHFLSLCPGRPRRRAA